MKRALSALLALAMACSLVPTPALAEMAEEATTASDENAIVLNGQAAAADAGAGIGEQATEDKDPSVEAGTGRQAAAEDKDADENGWALVNDEEPDTDGQVAAANVAEDKGADDPVLAAQSDLSGSFVDEASGATWYVRWYEEVGLAITAVNLAEGEGPVDIVVPAGQVVFTTDDGGQAEGTIATVADAFYHWGGTNEARERVRSVTIPNTITHIYGRMFGLHMPNLKTVTFEPASEDPEDVEHAGVTTLPESFFAQSDVENVTLPTNLTAISKSMFHVNRVIKSIVLPPHVEEIEDEAFSNCTALESVTFNEGLRRIGDRAFDHWDMAEHPRLTTAELPNSLESIGWRAFRDMDTLTSVSFGTSLTESQLTTIGEAAFENCALAEVRIPDSVTTIGPWAFASNRAKDANGNEHYTIQAIALGSSQETSQLQTIGSRAFFRSQITTIALPNKLTNLGYDVNAYDWHNHWFDHTWEHGDCTGSAFYTSTELTNIDWPTAPPADGLGLDHIGGFDNCRKLSPSVIQKLPWWITTIDSFGFGQSFTQSGETTLTIPASVSHICEKAFAGACDTWQSIPQLSTVIIEDGIEPLDIDWRAFDNSFAPGGTMRLPKRTANLAAEAFPEKRNYYVYNENVQIAEGVFPWESQSTVYYPDTAADDSAIVLHKNSCAQAGRPTEFLPFEVIPRHDIEGRVPAGASVAFYVGGNKTEVDLEDGTSLRTRVEDGSIVRVVVSLDGYADYTLQPSNDGKLLDDWSFNVQESALTPIHTTGDLAVTVTKNHLLEENRIRAAIGCNVVVFNGLGKMVAHGTTSTSTMYFANGLSAGTYTVVAFDKNEYFSVVSGLDDFARLGVAPGSWVTAQATIEAGKTTNLSLEVPEFSVLSAQTLLESGSVVLTDARIVQGLPFSARISLKMKDGHEATKVQVSIPQGIALQSVNSQGHAYGTSGFDASTRILSIDLRDADKKSTTIYLGLLATGEAASSSSLSASVASGAATAPLGSAIVDASGLMLEVPQGRLSSPTFTAEVYAAPRTTVRFRVGQTDLDTQVTTNLAGHATATLTIPEAEMDVFSFYAVTALATGEDGTELWTTERIEYEAGVSSWSTREWELSFVHGGKVNYLVKDGVPEPNPYYTCYALVGHAPGFYSPTWPFTSIIDSDRALANKQTLMLRMLDGTMRSETMTLVKKQPLEGDTVRYTYLASVPFGDGNPFHDLLAKDIPCGFEVVPEYEDLDTVPEPPALTQANINNIKLLLRKKSTDLQNRVYALREAHAAEDPNFDSEGILESHIFSGEYRNVMADMGRIVDPDVRQAILSSTEISEQLREAFREKYEEVDRLNAEYAKTVEDAFDLLQEMCGDTKPMYAYDSLDAYLQGELGYQRGLSVTPSQLEAQGFRIIYDRDLTSVPDVGTYDPVTGTVRAPEWIAVKVTVPKIEDDETIGSQDDLRLPDESSVEVYDSFGTHIKKGVTDVLDFVTSDQRWAKFYSGMDNNRMALDATISRADNIADWLRNNYSAVPKSVRNTLGSVDDAVKTAKGLKAFEPIMEGLGHAAFAYQQITDGYSLVTNIMQADDLARERASLDRRAQRFRDSGRTNTLCYRMLQEEAAATIDYEYDHRIAATIAGGDAAVGMAVYVCGALCGGPAAPFILGVGLVMYAGTLAYNYRQSGYLSGHQQDYEAKKSLREAACGDKKNTKHKAKAGIDPSGYVFEAVDDNRVEGATATIQYSDDGGQTWSTWDEAEEYEQTRTQVTDAAGTFAWDVPMGLWRVAFEAEGYEDAYTAAMEVPPARTGLAVPMVSVLSPAVESVTADDQFVEVVFKQYMDTSTLPVVTMAGQALSDGSWVDPSPAPNADATYARVFTAPVPAGTKLGSTLPVSVAGAVNYAGRALEPAWTGDVTIAPRATQILLDYEGAVPHVAGTTRDVAVQVLDASGRPLEGASVTATTSNAKLATVVGTNQKTNDAGGSTVSVQALLPGTCKLTFAVEGTGLSHTIDLVTTLEASRVARPGAAFASTTVTRTTTPKASYYVLKGTELSLATETEDAVVYYSTDGSDPASVATRKAYESPLKLSANTLVRAVAYKDGMEFSEELALTFKMRKSIAQATVAAIKAKSYTGKALAPKPTVKMGTTTLKLGTDYTLAYKNNVKVGTATITITGKGKYTSTKKVTFKINKATNPLTAIATTREALYKSVKQKAVVVARPLAVSKNQGKVTYAKASGSAAFAVNKTTGKVTIKKGTKKGTYTIKIKVTAAGNANYKAGSKTIACKVVVADKYTNPMAVSAVARTAKLATLKKQAVTVAAPLKFATKAQGTVTYAKASGSAAFAVNKTTGKVTIKKGTKKGTYTIKIKVTAAGNTSYKAATKTVTCKITIK